MKPFVYAEDLYEQPGQVLSFLSGEAESED
jgi:hypothetical protein